MLEHPRQSLQCREVPAEKFSRHVENLIAEFRGLPTNKSRSRLRESKSLGDAVDKLLHKYRVGMKTPEESIRDAWVEIVGETNARFCHPLRVERDRVLVIGVSNPVVRQEMLFHKALILKRVQAIPACHHITELAYRAG